MRIIQFLMKNLTVSDEKSVGNKSNTSISSFLFFSRSVSKRLGFDVSKSLSGKH